MEAFQPFDDRFQLRAFLAQSLGAFWIIPNIRFLQFAIDFNQAFAPVFKVKDTPLGMRSVLEDFESG